MPSNIYKFGSPSNYDTGQGERGLKSWAKYPAKTAQMWGSKIFQIQVAHWLHENTCLNKVMKHYELCMNIHTPKPTQKEGFLGKPKYKITPNITRNGVQTLYSKICSQYIGSQDTNRQTNKNNYNKLVMSWFNKTYNLNRDGQYNSIWTEWINPQGILYYCACPDYCHTGQWYNWCMDKWAPDCSTLEV